MNKSFTHFLQQHIRQSSGLHVASSLLYAGELGGSEHSSINRNNSLLGNPSL